MKDMQIKDAFINQLSNRTLDDYRLAISRLGSRLNLFDAEAIKDYLLKKDEKVDFIKFCQIHIDRLMQDCQTKSASTYRTVRYSLIDYFGREQVMAEEITIGMLKDYERYLRKERILTRVNQHGKIVTTKSRGLSDTGVHNYLRDLKGLFSVAQAYYNKPSMDIIPLPYNPFKEYKLVELPETKKRNLSIKQIISLKDCVVKDGSRAKFAKDLFMLSFYLCGMNAVDFYSADYQINDGRLEYNRSKTKGKRRDKGFISLHVPKEAEQLINKYNGLNDRYPSIDNLNAALSKGMKELSDVIKVPGVTFYWARHTLW